MKAVIPESLVESTILSYLMIKGFYVWKNRTTGVYDPKIKKFRKNIYALNGVSDILGVLPDGKFLAIEVKKPSIRGIQQAGKLSQDQKLFLNSVKKQNGIAFVADSLDTVIENLSEYL